MERKTITPNGDMELADYPARMDDGWLNIGWLITKHCNLGCPYCVGFKLKGQHPTSLLDTLSPSDLADRFARIREDNGREIYLTISGGEPSYVPLLPEFAGELTKRKITVELHTNFTLADQIQSFMEHTNPAYVAQFMATYHRWAHKSQPELRDTYFSLCQEAVTRGYLPVCKVMVMPGKVAEFFEEEVPFLRDHLPDEVPILPWGFIMKAPKSQDDYGGAYPYSYSEEEHALLDEHTRVRGAAGMWYRRGAGWHYKMPCAAGANFAYMNTEGAVWRCFGHGTSGGKSLGNLEEGVVLNGGPEPCPYRYCGTPYWALWFGESPWENIKGATKEDFWFCKYGPGRVE